MGFKNICKIFLVSYGNFFLNKILKIGNFQNSSSPLSPISNLLLGNLSNLSERFFLTTCFKWVVLEYRCYNDVAVGDGQGT